jgi:hypothetical protein
MIPRSKYTYQDARTTNEKDDEKEKPPENSTLKRFPITLQERNSYDRDPRRLGNHKKSPNKQQTHQVSKKG